MNDHVYIKNCVPNDEVVGNGMAGYGKDVGYATFYLRPVRHGGQKAMNGTKHIRIY